MIILVDMDGVLCDFEKHFLEQWHKLHPGQKIFEYGKRELFDITTGTSNAKLARAIIEAPDFYSNLPEIDGAVKAIKTMKKLGHDVYIVTSAGMNLPFAPSAKYRWVIDHIGPEWVRWLVITKSKYTVRGDILIDDKPKLSGEARAEWEHVLYDWSYNRSIKDKRRLTWKNWREVLDI